MRKWHEKLCIIISLYARVYLCLNNCVQLWNILHAHCHITHYFTTSNLLYNSALVTEAVWIYLSSPTSCTFLANFYLILFFLTFFHLLYTFIRKAPLSFLPQLQYVPMGAHKNKLIFKSGIYVFLFFAFSSLVLGLKST